MTKATHTQWTGNVEVLDPGIWDNDDGPEGWFAVVDDQGIKAYAGTEELADLIAAAPALKEALERLARAAACRENTMGDPARLIEVQAELRDATNEARAALALTEKAT